MQTNPPDNASSPLRVVEHKEPDSEAATPPLPRDDHLRLNNHAARRALYKRMRNAANYDEFSNAAMALDMLEGRESWKHEPWSNDFDYELIQRRLYLLRKYSSSKKESDQIMLLISLRSGLLRNLGGLGSPSLYSSCHMGTKYLIEEYTAEAVKQLRRICDEDEADPAAIGPKAWGDNLQKKFEFFYEIRQSFGRTALLLSGGASLGMYHFGVIKALWEQGLLPRVVSGSSVGSLVAAILCVKSDEEMPTIFLPGAVSLKAFESSQKGSVKRKLWRLISTGVLMDIRKLEEIVRANVGDVTFKEAYDRTGRILNITVASTTRYEVPRLLNYLTSPNVLIWSASCASCALKGLYEPVALMAKDSRGRIVEYHPSGVKWSDGSVVNDLPMTRLSELFNVNHFVVSQVNPHVVPFLRGDRDQAKKKGLTWKFTYLISSELTHRTSQVAELGIFPEMMEWIQPLLTQKYSGDVTIVPDVPLRDFTKILSNPTDELKLRCTKAGERATWPKLGLIKNRCEIEITLEYCVQRMRQKMHQAPTYRAKLPSYLLNDWMRPMPEVMGHGNHSRLLARQAATSGREGVGRPKL